jgi:signal transduction histidine kinase
MDSTALYQRYQDLQRYVGWTAEDAARVSAIADRFEPLLPQLVEDFYAEIERHAAARAVITGGAEQINRLKQTLIQWLRELLSGCYDARYVERRWRVGYRHVEIGLDQVYTNVALSRLRTGLHKGHQGLVAEGAISQAESTALGCSLDKLLDLDLAIIEDAYQGEFHRRQQQTERFATIGKVAGGVAHELRNPLNVIKTSAYYLLNAKQLSEQKLGEHLQRIERQVELADAVITALNSFAKLGLPAVVSVNIESWLSETLASVELPKNIEVILKSSAAIPAAKIDPDQMSIVLRNLIRNASDAMPQGGTLTITTGTSDRSVWIEVADTGTGIEPADLSRIMEPLFTTKARGIGLGLAMAKAITEKNGGRLSVVSEVGRGSVFTIRMQAATNAGPADALHAE